MANDLSDFYDYVLPYLHGAAPTPVLDLEIQRVLRQFCRRTTLVREVLVVTGLTPNQAGLVLTPTATNGVVDIAGVFDVEINGTFQNGLSPPQFTRLDVISEPRQPRTGQYPQSAQPRGFSYFPPASLVFYPQPDLAYPVNVSVYETQPLSTAQRSYPVILENYWDAIGHGVIAAMLMMPGKPWTDPQNAMLYQRLYGDRALAIRDQLRSGGVPNAVTLTAPRFGV